MSKMVNTVLGHMTAEQLGKTFMHGRFAFEYPGYSGNSVHEIFLVHK